MVLSGENRILTGPSSATNGLVLGTESYSEGQQYWEVSIDQMDSGATNGYLCLGVAPSHSTNYNEWMGSGNYIAWCCCSHDRMASLSPRPATGRFTQGDRVGILLDCEKSIMQMYVNGKFESEVDIPKATYFPAFACLSTRERITLIENPSLPSLHTT